MLWNRNGKWNINLTSAVTSLASSGIICSILHMADMTLHILSIFSNQVEYSIVLWYIYHNYYYAPQYYNMCKYLYRTANIKRLATLKQFITAFHSYWIHNYYGYAMYMHKGVCQSGECELLL